jgi:alpha-glucosidase (family GH31 glycosyl hydrolase)
MKKYLFQYIWLLYLPLVIWAETPGNILSYDQQNNIVIVYCQNADIHLTGYQNSTIRIDVRPLQTDFDPLAYPELAAADDNFTWEIVENSESLTLRGGDFQITLTKTPFDLNLSKASGTTLTRTAANGVRWGTGFSRITFAMQDNDHFYGFGQKGIDIDKRGHAFGMYNRPVYGYGGAEAEMNINIPFFFSLQGYGMYFHNSYPGYFDMGSQDSDAWYYFNNREEWLSFFVFTGSGQADILSAYTRLTGFSPMLPAWALGHLQSKYGYETQSEAADIVATFRDKNLPLDAIILDLYWFSNMGDIAWDFSRFPDPSGMITGFLSDNVRTVLITEPYVRTNSSNYSEADAQNYFGYKADGTTYDLPGFWFGPAALLDFTRPTTVEWWWNKHIPLIDQGIGGWWTDLCEPELHPDDMQHYLGEARRVHNVMNLLWSKMFADKYDEMNALRLFNLTRSGYAGSQKYGAVTWSGDVARTFQAMRVQTNLMLSMAQSGMPYHHHDIGGFTGDNTTPELFVRWMQLGVFSPIMRPHSAFQSVEPWAFGAGAETIVAQMMALRQSLYPYNYTYFHQTTQTGESIIQPLVRYYPEDISTYNMSDQYFWGDDILVAPILFEGATSRQVYFPRGVWIDAWSGAVIEGDQSRTIQAPLEQIPHFIRHGAIIPRMPKRSAIMERELDTLLVDIYPANDGHFRMYEDDGLSFDYRNGAYSYTDISYTKTATIFHCTFGSDGGHYAGKPDERTYLFRIKLQSQIPDSVYWEDSGLELYADLSMLLAAGSGWAYDATHKQILVLNNENTDRFASIDVFGYDGYTSVTDTPQIPDQMTLLQNYPNPFNPSTRIKVRLDQKRDIQLRIYDVSGRLIKTVFKGTKTAGEHVFLFHSEQLASGTYFYILEAKGFRQSRKMILLR